MDDQTTLSPQVETCIVQETGVLSNILSFFFLLLLLLLLFSGKKAKQVTPVLIVLQEALPGGR